MAGKPRAKSLAEMALGQVCGSRGISLNASGSVRSDHAIH